MKIFLFVHYLLPAVFVGLLSVAVPSRAAGQVLAGGTGAGIDSVECRNASTGETVRSSDPSTEWDCSELGVTSVAGDRVAITFFGSVPAGGLVPRAEGTGAGLLSVAPLFVGSELSSPDDSAGHSDAADFDLDGDLDLLFSAQWLEFEADDPLVFTEHAIPGANGFLDTWAGDLDNDGRADAAYVSNDHRLYWFENTPGNPPSFVERETLFRDLDWEFGSLGGGDLDGDGDTDLVSSIEDRTAVALARLQWHENAGNGDAFSTQVLYEIPENVKFAFAIADADLDGDLDLVVTAFLHELVWFENDGAAEPTFERHLIEDDFGPSDVSVGDLDNDGDLDLIAGWETNELRLYENVDGQFDQLEQRASFLDGNTGGVRAVGSDLNRDGWLDLHLPGSLSSPHPLRWLENRGDWTFEDHQASYVSDLVPFFRSEAADLDGDGQVDLFGEGTLTQAVRVEARTRVGGWVVGLEGMRARCRNLSTGQSVGTANSGPEVDCEALGLVVNPGDRVRVWIGGRVAS